MANSIGKGCNTLSVGSDSAVIFVRSLALTHSRSALRYNLAEPTEKAAIPLFRVSLKLWNLLFLRHPKAAQSSRKRIIARCSVSIPTCRRLRHSLKVALRLGSVLCCIAHVRSLYWSQGRVSVTITLRNELFLLRHLGEVCNRCCASLNRLSLKLTGSTAPIPEEINASTAIYPRGSSVSSIHHLIIIGIFRPHQVMHSLRIAADSYRLLPRLLRILIIYSCHSLLFHIFDFIISKYLTHTTKTYNRYFITKHICIGKSILFAIV